jgi:hypothetical protein
MIRDRVKAGLTNAKPKGLSVGPSQRNFASVRARCIAC